MHWSSMITLVPFVAALALALTSIIFQVLRITWLRLHGKRIIALVTSIRQEGGGSRRENYYVTATWTHPRSGKTYAFWTWSINHRPACRQGSLVPVLIDPANPQRYLLDL